ncbi:hypothetical protein SEVIR_4G032300v4 [Setaria viridis]|uniref:Uncharacterized protein n=1 Tax=Setaria viridis TaxID=4556 RepID=A0A4U6USZ3_SETVI|nr:anthocyanin 5-aromatic acyltransferase-like [Setaria viridis]TKW19620.1 hypothetical protein SEVIR_4G032300v2 [Setaria viridis]
MSSRVRVLSVTHVRPAETPNPPPHDADHSIKLSLFDTLFIALTPIRRLFFYEGDDLPPFPALVRTLRSSLAATLAVFTPLAGRVAVSPSGEDVAIDCSPGTVSRGVRFVEAEYAGTADDVRRMAGAAEHDAEAYAQLAPALEVSALPAPALAVQVTRPAADVSGGDGGGVGALVVGVSVNHVVADGRAVWEFIRAWAAAARGGSTAGTGFVPPTFDRAAINGCHPKAEEVARKFLRTLAPALPTQDPDQRQARRTYLLSASQIRSLKHRISLHNKGAAAATAPASAANPPTTSTYAAVASLVWTSAVRAKNALNHAGDDAYLMFAADCRARLRPPLPDAFFGNCAKACYARATVGGLRDGGGEALARAAAAVREAVREQLADPVADAGQWLERHRALPPDRTVQVGASDRFAAYETDFGWGRPARVELASVFVKEFVAVVGAPDGAVQVSVALDRDRMDGFEANFLSQLQLQASS